MGEVPHPAPDPCLLPVCGSLVYLWHRIPGCLTGTGEGRRLNAPNPITTTIKGGWPARA